MWLIAFSFLARVYGTRYEDLYTEDKQMYGELRNKDNKKIREKEYYEMLQKELEKRAGEDTEISFRNVRKNNGVYKKACTIRFHDAQIAPTVYLEPYYNHYLDGQAVAESADNILNYCRCSTPDITVPDNFFKEYSTVKGRLGIKLIGKERNEAYLREVPHIDGEILQVFITIFWKTRHSGTE